MRKKIGENQKDKGKRLSVTKEDSDSDSTNSSSTSISSGVTRLSIGSSDSDEDLLESKENSLNEVKKNKEYIKTLAAQLLDGWKSKYQRKLQGLLSMRNTLSKIRKKIRKMESLQGLCCFMSSPLIMKKLWVWSNLPKN